MFVSVVFGGILLLRLGSTSSPYIDNRSPDAIYVIPIYKNQSAVVHCVSYFAKTIFEVKGGEAAANCQKCELQHVQFSCCRVVSWDEVKEQPLSLVCTLEKPEWNKNDPNIPKIRVSVVKRNSDPMRKRNQTTETGQTVAFSNEIYFCNHKSNVSHLTAGSHIGLGWVSVPSSQQAEYTMEPSTETAITDKQQSLLLESISDNVRNKLAEFSKYYSNPEFEPLWVSEDEKVELKRHKSTFTCNETSYFLPKGSRCMTPSARAYFVMTNCNLVEQIFVVIGVIVLLILLYIIFNVMVWLWDYVRHKSHKHDDDLAPMI